MLLEFILPQSCYFCRNNGSPVCIDCLGKLPTAENKCLECQIRIASPSAFCNHCNKNNIDLMVFSCAKLDDGFRHLLHQFKYEDLSAYADPLAEFAYQRLKASKIILTRFDIICPVPISSKRLLYRGYNQSALVARALGKKINIIYQEILTRTGQNQTQVAVGSRKLRQKNIVGAFQCKLNLQNKRIILVDDITTTGATIREAAKILKRSGARQILIISLARG